MILTQHFSTDFDLLTAGLRKGYRGEPYAFVRFGDGEYAIMRGQRHVAKSDGWEWPAGQISPLGHALRECLGMNFERFYLGITAHEHHPEQHDTLMRGVNCPRSNIGHAEAFIFANYARFRAIDISHCVIVAPKAPLGHFLVPHDAVMTGWDHRPLVDALLRLAPGNPILVSAGPVANIIIQDYWLRCPWKNKRVILDVGSALDQQTRGRRTRNYQHATSPQARWTPRFWPVGEK